MFYRVLLPNLLWKTRQHRSVTYDVIDKLRRLSLSKCFPALCHKLIYEIAIFHSINRETCDNEVLTPINGVQQAKPIRKLTIRIGLAWSVGIGKI